MAVALVGTGAPSILAGTNTPTAPAFSAGQTLIYYTWVFGGGSLTTFTGGAWTDLNPGGGITQLRVFGFQSITGSESMPSSTWSAGTSGTLVEVYSGVGP